jgi:hypothetical protein
MRIAATTAMSMMAATAKMPPAVALWAKKAFGVAALPTFVAAPGVVVGAPTAAELCPEVGRLETFCCEEEAFSGVEVFTTPKLEV